MILSDTEIRKAMALGSLIVDPLKGEDVRSASIDLHLSSHFRVFDLNNIEIIDPFKEQPELTNPRDTNGGPFILHPGEFALGSTRERFEFGDNLAGRLEGKSSLGRLGLEVHSTAGFFDPGFHGYATLEMSNNTRLPIRLLPGMKIAQMCFIAVAGRVEKPYGTVGKYQDAPPEPQPSAYFKDYVE